MLRHSTTDRRLVSCVALLAIGWCLATLAFVLGRSTLDGLHFTGIYAGLFPGDQLRYLAWIRSAGLHLLIADPFSAGASHIYLHPVFLISGLLWRAGLSLQLSYLIWTPIALATLAWGYTMFVGRFLAGREFAAALALSLLFFSPLVPLLDYGRIVDANGANYLVIAAGHGAAYWQAWGFLPTVIALGLVPVVLVGVVREDVTWTSVARTSLAALLVAWLHPWGGIEVVVIIAGLAALQRGLPPRLAIPGVAAALPLIYYAVLSEVDPAWSLSELRTGTTGPVWPLLFAYVPLLVFGLPALRTRPRSPLEQCLRLWLVAVALTFVVVRGSPDAALEGASLPLAVLAVQSWRHFRLSRTSAWLALALAIVPGAFYSAHTFRDLFYSHDYPFALSTNEQRAIASLERDPPRGDVLATPYLEQAMPALAGFLNGQTIPGSEAFFDGRYDPEAAATLPNFARISLVIVDCRPRRADLSGLLRPFGFRRVSFGCARVYRR